MPVSQLLECAAMLTRSIPSRQLRARSVLVRLRPLDLSGRPTASSSQAGSVQPLTCITAHGPSQLQYRGPGGSQQLAFDGILGPDADQSSVYASCSELCDAAVAGFNACVMSYGQTGSGKTHTLVGDRQDGSQQQLGIIPRAAQQLCKHMEAAVGTEQLACTLSCIEVYCERVRDLLVSGDTEQDLPISQVCVLSTLQALSCIPQNWLLVQDKVKGITIPGLTEAAFDTFPALSSLLEAALARRSTAATGMNAASSRSHCIVTFTVTRTISPQNTARSKLRLVRALYACCSSAPLCTLTLAVSQVDLAGSERSDRTGAQGTTFEEGKVRACLSALPACLPVGHVELTRRPAAHQQVSHCTGQGRERAGRGPSWRQPAHPVQVKWLQCSLRTDLELRCAWAGTAS